MSSRPLLVQSWAQKNLFFHHFFYITVRWLRLIRFVVGEISSKRSKEQKMKSNVFAYVCSMCRRLSSAKLFFRSKKTEIWLIFLILLRFKHTYIECMLYALNCFAMISTSITYVLVYSDGKNVKPVRTSAHLPCFYNSSQCSRSRTHHMRS